MREKLIATIVLCFASALGVGVTSNSQTTTGVQCRQMLEPVVGQSLATAQKDANLLQTNSKECLAKLSGEAEAVAASKTVKDAASPLDRCCDRLGQVSMLNELLGKQRKLLAEKAEEELSSWTKKIEELDGLGPHLVIAQQKQLAVAEMTFQRNLAKLDESLASLEKVLEKGASLKSLQQALVHAGNMRSINSSLEQLSAEAQTESGEFHDCVLNALATIE